MPYFLTRCVGRLWDAWESTAFNVTVHRKTVCISWFELRSNCILHRKDGRARRAAANLHLPTATIGSLTSASALPYLLFFPCNYPLSEAQIKAILFSCERLPFNNRSCWPTAPNSPPTAESSPPYLSTFPHSSPPAVARFHACHP